MRHTDARQEEDDWLQVPVLPSDVSDVLVAGGVASVSVQTHGAWGVWGGRLTADRGLVILTRLEDNGTGTLPSV